jgi:hypothetical protein
MRGQETVSDKPPHSPLKIIKDYAGSTTWLKAWRKKEARLSGFVTRRPSTGLTTVPADASGGPHHLCAAQTHNAPDVAMRACVSAMRDCDSLRGSRYCRVPD